MAGYLFDELDRVRARTLELVAPFAQRQLDFEPAPGRWSIGQVLDHLLAADRLYREEIAELIARKRAGRRPYLRRSFRDINIKPLFLPDALLPWLDLPFTVVNRVTPDAFRDLLTRLPIVPSGHPDRGAPRARRPGPELRRGLVSSLAALRALVDANADLDFTKLVLEHPVTGVSHVPRILAFVAEHERRHHRQIDGIRRHRKFPPSG